MRAFKMKFREKPLYNGILNIKEFSQNEEFL